MNLTCLCKQNCPASFHKSCQCLSFPLNGLRAQSRVSPVVGLLPSAKRNEFVYMESKVFLYTELYDFVYTEGNVFVHTERNEFVCTERNVFVYTERNALLYTERNVLCLQNVIFL
jgi:hypothetical protein